MAKRGRPRKVKVEEPVQEDLNKEKEVQDFVADGIEQNDVSSEIKEPVINSSEPVSALKKLSQEGKKYSPLGESVTEKDYRTPKVENTASIGDIDEPYFERPTLEDLVRSNEEDTGETNNPFAQSEMGEMSSAAQEESAKGLVEMSLNLYTLGCKGMGSLAKISEKKLNNLVEDGSIDIGIRVPVDRYNTASIPDVVNNFNTEVADAFVVTDEFKDEVRPIMTRVFVKNGWGMSDEQQLMMLFGMDLVQKGSVVIQMRKAAQFQLDTFMEMTKVNNAQNVQFASDEPVMPTENEEETQEQSENEVEEKVFESKVENSISETMTATLNPDLQVSEDDLKQVDVDNV